MPLHLSLPIEPDDNAYLDRISALQEARNRIGPSVQSGAPLAPVLLTIIDELIAQLQERQGQAR
jgi:hypothetical protein